MQPLWPDWIQEISYLTLHNNVFFFAALRGRAAQQPEFPEGFALCDDGEGSRPGRPELRGALSLWRVSALRKHEEHPGGL